MSISLTFLGAAQNVTGSRYRVEAEGVRFLVDCGLYQERELRMRNWAPFPVSPQTLKAVLLTHAHIDHCGLLPKLVREGFHGHIYCTSATADITEIMLLDAAKLLQEDAEFKKKRHEREDRKGPYPEVPLYTIEDARACLPLLSPVAYGEPVPVGNGIAATFYDAGHVLGSSIVKVEIKQKGEPRTILFSGDLGRWNEPLLPDPTLISEGDYVLVESTYGNRLHEGSGSVGAELAKLVNSTIEAGGNIVIPSFALERTQEVLYHLRKLTIEGRIPHLVIFVDSPMATRVTEVFRKYPQLFDKEISESISQGNSPFDFPGLVMTKTVEEAKAVNHIAGTAVIIAGSGMCTGGRIKQHLVANISRPESTILFVGYQAEGTLGRQIVEGAAEVRILGQEYPVRARVAQINGFSAHADRDELLRWLSGFRRPPSHTFVVHGEPQAACQFADYVRKMPGWKASVPKYQDEVVLE